MYINIVTPTHEHHRASWYRDIQFTAPKPTTIRDTVFNGLSPRPHRTQWVIAAFVVSHCGRGLGTRGIPTTWGDVSGAPIPRTHRSYRHTFQTRVETPTCTDLSLARRGAMPDPTPHPSPPGGSGTFQYGHSSINVQVAIEPIEPPVSQIPRDIGLGLFNEFHPPVLIVVQSDDPIGKVLHIGRIIA